MAVFRSDLVSRGLRASLIGGLVPAFSGGCVYGLGASGAKGVFQAEAVMLWSLAALGAWLATRPASRRDLALAGVTALLGGALLHLLLRGGGGLGSLLTLASTMLLVGYGVARLGLGLRLPPALAALMPLLVLGLGCTALFWADPVGAPFDPADRLPARTAMLAWDPLTTLAQDAAGFDRLHDGPIYSRIDLAASSVLRPTTGGILLRWGVLGLLALGVGVTLHRHAPVAPPRS